MGTVIVLVILSICVGITVWARYCKRGDTAPVLPEALSPAHKAFVHGNTCLREGKFAEATTNFRQALEFDPKHPHVIGRLAEVERQQAASNMVPAHAKPGHDFLAVNGSVR
jgi:Tfp pilus assembly protein PilF